MLMSLVTYLIALVLLTSVSDRGVQAALRSCSGQKLRTSSGLSSRCSTEIAQHIE